MPGSVTMNEAAGQPLVDTDADFSMCVVGYTTSSAVAAGHVSPVYSVPAAAVSDAGVGDAMDVLTQATTVTPGNPAPPPCALYTSPATTPGSYPDAAVVSGVTGTAVVTNDAATAPKGTYEPWMRVVTGGLIGVDGMTAYASLNGGRQKTLVSLGTTLGYAFPASDGWGISGRAGFAFAPSTTNAAYVALAVELRADVLAHLANNTAHDGTDTSAGQIALNASSVPATVAASTAVVNLVLTALLSHVTNITSVHDGPDLVAYTALAALSAATDAKTGIDLAIAIKGIFNTHDAAALAAGAGGALHAATATTVAVQTLLAASMLSGGVAALDAQPRRLVLTTAGGTASDAPATVAITGFDYAGAAQSETLTVAQTATTATSAKAWKGTGLSLVYAAGDGTGATIAVSYSNGVHNSADVTNTVAAADPTYGTLLANDVFYTATLPPQWAVADLYAAASGPTPASGAFAAVATSEKLFGKIVLTEPMAASDFSTVVAGLNFGLARGKRWSLIARFRDPTTGETDAAYILAFQTFVAACLDNRISYLAGSCYVSDAYTGRVYSRTFMAPYVARVASFKAVPGQEGERLAQNAGWVARGPLEGASLKDSDGNTIGHDEAIRGGISADNGAPHGGGIALYYQQIAAKQGTYVDNRGTVAYPVSSAILVPGDRAVANAIETAAIGVALDAIGGADVFDAETLELDEDIRTGLEGRIAKVIRDNYDDEIQNAADPGLVTINTVVTVSGAQVTISGTIHVRFYGYTDTVALTFQGTR